MGAFKQMAIGQTQALIEKLGRGSLPLTPRLVPQVSSATNQSLSEQVMYHSDQMRWSLSWAQVDEICRQLGNQYIDDEETLNWCVTQAAQLLGYVPIPAVSAC